MDYWSSRALQPVSTGALLNSLADFKQAVSLLEASGDRETNTFLEEMRQGIRMMTKELERRGMRRGLKKSDLVQIEPQSAPMIKAT